MPPGPETQTDADVALAAAAAGAAVVRALYGTELDHLEKSPTDFATEADLRAEEAIREVIAAARPDDGFHGEESGVIEGAGGRRWLVDPLCGTLNFAAGTPLAAVNVALQTPLGVTAAACADPVAEEIFWTDGGRAYVRHGVGGAPAAHGTDGAEGADGTDRPARPSARSLVVDVNCDGPRDAPFLGAQLIADQAFREVFAPRVLSTTLAVAWVADGRRAAYVTDGRLEGSVHFAAGIAICRAAGCVVTDLAGDPLHTGRGLIAAADAETHARLLALVRPHLAALA